MIFLDEKHAPRFRRDLADSLITLLGAGEKLIQDGQVRDTYHGRRSYLQSVLGMMFWEALRQYRDANLAYEKSLSPCEISHPQRHALRLVLSAIPGPDCMLGAWGPVVQDTIKALTYREAK